MRTKSTSYKRNNILLLAYSLIIIIAVNTIGQYVYTRLDLTQEKRYTLAPATTEMLEDLDEYVFFKIYLEGEFPAGFKRLRNETKEMLNEFRAVSPYIEYEFINPSESSDIKERQKEYKILQESGLQPTNLQINRKGENAEQLIFPGAIVTYLSKETTVDLLQTHLMMAPEEILNNSIENLEFTLASAIRQLSMQSKPRIAFIEGHGELNRLETADIGNTLAEQYVVDRVEINGQINSLSEFKMYDTIDKLHINDKYDALIIAKPNTAFSEKDKFIIDQYIMRGGRVLWLIDPVYASMDSLQKARNTLGIGIDLNLDDMFFKYGVRFNQELLMDLNARPIPIVTGMVGNQPQQEFLPWYYFPIVNASSKHPIVNNMNAIMTDFPCTLDTVKSPGLKKTSLLASSKYSRIQRSPALIDLQIMDGAPDARLYNLPPQMVGVLIEGEFKSLFANRVPPQLDSIGYTTTGKAGAQIFISDGDIIKNQLHYSKGYPIPLGMDQFTRQNFGNKDFILNALNYLIDESGLISIRSRDIKLRLLDKNRMEDAMIWIKTINVIIPVLLIIIMGVFLQWRRKQKYRV